VPAHLDRVDVVAVQVLTVVEDLALDPGPGIRSFMRFRQRIRVLLPQPEGPMKAVISCLLISRLTPRRARKLP
jgi:hypothetical protein